MPMTAVNGVDLYYEEHGSGTPIVGIHGGGSSAVFWEDAAETLAELGRVIIYDRRGSNRSERPADYETTSIAEHAADALALIRALDAEPAVLIGRSYGGTIALEIGLGHPESVLGIALLEAGTKGLSVEYDAWFESLAQTVERSVAERGVGAVGEDVIRAVFGAWDELPDVWRNVFTRNGQALLAEVRGGETVDLDHLADLSVPALVVTADGSPTPIQRGSEALADALPEARSVRVGGDHAIDPGGPEVLGFVRDIVAAART